MSHPLVWLTAAITLAGLLVPGQAAPVHPNEGLLPCGDALYESSMYACLEGYSMCPVVDGEPMQRCGDACYLPDIYTCSDGHLILPQKMRPLPSSTMNGSTTPMVSLLSTPSSGLDENASTSDSTPLAPGDFTDPDHSDDHHQPSTEALDPIDQTMFTTVAPEPTSSSEVVSTYTSAMPQSDQAAGSEGSSSSVWYPRVTVEIFPFDDWTTTSSNDGLPRLDLHGQTISTTFLEITLDGSAALDQNPTDTAATSGFYTKETLSAVSLDQTVSQTEAVGFKPSDEASSAATVMTLSSSDRADGLPDDGPEDFNSEPDSFTTDNVHSDVPRAMVATGPLASIDWAVSNKSLCAVIRARDNITASSPVYASLRNTSLVDRSFLYMPEFDTPIVYDRWTNFMAFSTLAVTQYSKADPAGFTSTIGVLMSRVQSNVPLYYIPILLAISIQDDPEGLRQLAERYGSRFHDDVHNVCMAILDKSAAFADAQDVNGLFHALSPLPYSKSTIDSLGAPSEMVSYVMNAAIIPAALRSMSSLVAADLLPHSFGERSSRYAQIWEDNTLDFFRQVPREEETRELLSWYTTGENPTAMPDSWLSDILYYGPGIGSSFNLTMVAPIMTMDDCFRLLLLNTTNDAQLSSFLDQTANHILKPYPFGLSVGDRFVTSNTVFINGLPDRERPGSLQDLIARTEESWTLPALAVGLGRQLSRCGAEPAPEFCKDDVLRVKIVQAYDELWRVMERQNEDHADNVHDLGVKRLDFI